jgi:hypothetical protein
MTVAKALPLRLRNQRELAAMWAHGETAQPPRPIRPRDNEQDIEAMDLKTLIKTQRDPLPSESRLAWLNGFGGVASLDQTNGEDENGDPVAFVDAITERNAMRYGAPTLLPDPAVTNQIEWEKFISQCGPVLATKPVATQDGRIALTRPPYMRPEAWTNFATRAKRLLAAAYGRDALTSIDALEARRNAIEEALDSAPVPYPANAFEARGLEMRIEANARRMDPRNTPRFASDCVHRVGENARKDERCTCYPGPADLGFAD